MDVVKIDSTKFTPYQLYSGIHKPTHTLKNNFYVLVDLWDSLRKGGLYDYSDKLREALKDMEWSLLYLNELEEKEVIFNKDRIKQ